MVRQGKRLVFRVQDIPVGSAAHQAYQNALKGLSSSALTLARSYISEISEQPFLSGGLDDQARDVLLVAIRLRELENLGADVAYGEPGVQILPTCSTNPLTRAALLYFKDDSLPEFLGRTRTNAPSEDVTLDFGQHHDIIFSTSFWGMTQLYAPTAEVIRADIIAVPGLDGHAFGSWKAKDTTGRMWLLDFFRNDFDDCRTFIYGYAAKLKDYNETTLTQYGEDFLNEIRKIRKEDKVGRELVWERSNL